MYKRQPFILSEPVTSKTDNAPIALICYPLRKDGVPYGFINGAIALNRLTELAQGIDFYDGVSWIMDSEGRNYTVLPEALSSAKLAQFAEHLKMDPPCLLYTSIFYCLFFGITDMRARP